MSFTLQLRCVFTYQYTILARGSVVRCNGVRDESSQWPPLTEIMNLIYYTPTNALLCCNSLKTFTLKQLKCPIHVSILRSSSGSVHCSLLKLYVKMLITLFYLSVMRQHIMCMCICCIYELEGSRSTAVDLFLCKGHNIHTICCRITDK